MNDHTFFVGWYDYVLAVGALPIEAQVFQAWYFALYPEKLSPEVDRTQFKRIFPKLEEESRADQKKALRAVIAKYRLDDELMSNLATDPRPLISPAPD